MSWFIPLEGRWTDLRVLTHLFTTDPRVEMQGGNHCLKSTRLDSLTDPREVIAEARILMATLNGAVRLRNTTYRNVVCREAADRVQGGNTHAFRYVTDSVGLSDEAGYTLTTADGQVARGTLTDDPNREEAIERVAVAAERDEQVARALRFFAEDPPTWTALYKVWEIIEHGVGRGHVEAAEWATCAELDAFTSTANHPALSGDAARHSTMRGVPKAGGISLEDGVELCRRLLSCWLLSDPSSTP